MGTPLKNPPVYFTVVQVRFNTILKLAEFVTGIQDRFRNTGFPDYDTQRTIAFQVVVQEDGQSVPRPVQQERFLFGNTNKTHLFMLDNQSLTLQSTEYGQFESFSETFLRGMNTIHEVVQLAYTERVGLRYLDRVMPAEEETLGQYLVNEVQGLGDRLGGKAVTSYTEMRNDVEDVHLVSRVVIQDGDLAFPPDLQAMGMSMPKRFVEYKGPSAILDNDGFIMKREAYSGEVIADHLSEIHKVIGAAFKATVTEHAFDIWNR